MGLGFSIKVAPGVRVRASSRGVRTSLGPRAARVHVGGGRTAVSTGAGPLTLYSALGGGARARARTRPGGRVSGPTPAQVRKAEEAARLAEVLAELRHIHRAPFSAATPPVAPPLPQPDVVAVYRRHEREALEGIGVLRRSERAAARQRGAAAAIAELAASSRAAQQQRDSQQRQLDALWEALCANDHDVVLATLEEAFEDNSAPAAAVGVSGSEASLLVLAPEPDIVPERAPSTTAAGNLSLRRMPQGDRDALYTEAVMGHVLVTLREAFAVAPGLQSGRVVACRPVSADAGSVVRLDCLLAGRWTRSSLDDVAWETTGAAEGAQETATELLVKLRSGRKLLPLDLDQHPEIAVLLDGVDAAELVG